MKNNIRLGMRKVSDIKCKENKFLLKSVKNNGYVTWRPIYILQSEKIQTKTIENILIYLK
jgi:hypothetical protein